MAAKGVCPWVFMCMILLADATYPIYITQFDYNASTGHYMLYKIIMQPNIKFSNGLYSISTRQFSAIALESKTQ